MIAQSDLPLPTLYLDRRRGCSIQHPRAIVKAVPQINLAIGRGRDKPHTLHATSTSPPPTPSRASGCRGQESGVGWGVYAPIITCACLAHKRINMDTSMHSLREEKQTGRKKHSVRAGVGCRFLGSVPCTSALWAQPETDLAECVLCSFTIPCPSTVLP